MKKTITLLALSLSTYFSFGQTYTFSKSIGAYSNLTGSTLLTGGLTWDDPQLTIPVGFNLQFFDSTVNKIYIEDYGLGGFLATNNTETGIIPTFVAYGSDIIDRGYDFSTGSGASGGLSPISYKVSGTSGNKILKIEWKNVGFYGDIDDNTISTDYVNFQVWFYEGSNNIEIHFGPNSVTQPALSYEGVPGSMIGFMPEYNYSTDDLGSYGLFLEGLASNPSMSIINSIDSLKFLNGTVPNGTIFKFTKSTVSSLVELNPNDFSLYPNPSNDYISINSDKEEIVSITVNDLSGKQVRHITQDFNMIHLSDINPGIYFAYIKTKNGFINKKFVKN